MPENYDQIVNITWTSEESVTAVKNLITALNEAEAKLNDINAKWADLQGKAGQGAQASATPAWYLEPPPWYKLAPDWWSTPPSWYATATPTGGASSYNPYSTDKGFPPGYQPFDFAPGRPLTAEEKAAENAAVNEAFGGGFASAGLPPIYESTAKAQADYSFFGAEGFPPFGLLEPTPGATGGYREPLQIPPFDEQALPPQPSTMPTFMDADRTRQATRAVEDYYKSMGITAEKIQNVSEASDLLQNRLMRHASWMAQGLLLIEVFRLMAMEVQNVVAQYTQLSDVSARLTAIGATGNVAGGVIGQYVAGAQYGIGTSQSGQGAITSARYGLTPAEQDQARQASLVYGVSQYNSILVELYQTKRMMQDVNVQEFDTMDTLATIYKHVTDNAQTAFGAMREALLVSKEIGTTPEATAVGIAQASVALGVSPESAGVSVQRLIKTISSNTTTQRMLQDLGVDTSGGTEQTLKTIIPLMNELQTEASRSEAGQQRYIEFINAVSGGGIMGASAALKMAEVIRDINAMFQQTGPVDNWGKVVGDVMDSSTVKANRLKTSWDALVASMVASPTAQNLMAAPLSWMDAQAQKNMREAQYSAIPDDLKKVFADQFDKTQGGYLKEVLKAIEVGGPMWQEVLRGWVEQYAINIMTGAGGYPDESSRAAGRAATGAGEVVGDTNIPFGFSQMTGVPGGQAYYQRLMELYQQRQTSLAATPGFSDTQTKEALTDWQGNVIPGSAANYDTTALKQAMDDLKREQQYSIIEPMKGVSFDMLQKQQQTAQARLMELPDYANQRTANVRTFEYYDETTQMWRSIQATQEEMNEATKQIAKNTLPTGVFNVPSGGRVPWAAIEAGYTTPDRAGLGAAGQAGLLTNALTPLINALAHFNILTGQMPMSIPPSGPPTPQAGGGSMLSIPQTGTGAQRGGGSSMLSIPQTGGGYALPPNDITINNTNPITVTVPINITLGSEVYQYLQSKMYETTNTQRRVSPGGGGGGRAYVL